jgi:membrane-bound lytic murein transglycosylase D
VLDRLAAGLDEAGCASPAVRRSMLALQRHPESLSSKFERTLPALDYVLRAIEEKGLPGQFALIPWAESGFRADPGNRGTVQGLWQFTVSTGRGHGLRIDQQFDGRRAAIESTAAAIEHLQRLQTRFLDWRISLLAYNAGEYRVARALKRGQVDASGLPSTLQAHSYAYLHKINALACLFGDIGLRTEWASDTPFDRLQPVRRPASARSTQQLARAAGIELDELLRYNAAFRNGEVADNAPALILLPGTVATRLLAGVTEPAIGIEVAQAAEINAHASNAATPVPPTQAMHTVSSGDTLWRIARRYRLALSDLLRWNGLSSRSIIRPGQRLRIRSD